MDKDLKTAEAQRITKLKDDIQSLCEAYMEERPMEWRAHGVMSALLYNASVFKGMFDAQGIETVDDELRRLIAGTESISKRLTEESLRNEVENGTSSKSAKAECGGSGNHRFK